MLTIDQLSHSLTKPFVLSLAAFLLSMLLTPIYSNFAYKHKLWKRPRTHSATGEELVVIAKQRIKRQIPLMAGLVILVSVAVVTLLFNLNRNQTWLPLAALVGGGAVGLIDDVINVRGKGGRVAGLRAPLKFAMVFAVAAIGAWFFCYKLGFNTIHLPHWGDVKLGRGIIALFILVLVSTANAVNITDGVDGLAGGLTVYAYGAFGIIAALQNNFGIAAFCFTVVGALLSYLWFNIPPARFLMGDVGSFALGISLGVVAMLTNTVLLLPLIGLVFVAEAGSVLLQIFSKKVFHRRIFISSPLHHHFEAKGWPKTKVTMRFWVIGQVAATLGVVLALIGHYI